MDKISMEDIFERFIKETGTHTGPFEINYKLDPKELLKVLNKIIKEASKMQETIELLEKRNEMLMNILSGTNISNIGDKIKEIENG